MPTLDTNAEVRMTTAEDARRFVLGGNAYFTLKSTATGTRFTYRVSAPKDATPSSPKFVGVLTGSDNNQDYTYLGCIWPDGNFAYGKKSRITPDAPSAKGFAWFWNANLRHGNLPSVVEFYHEGRCGCCGRRLTTPESVTLGFGPECAEKMGGVA